MEISDNLGSKAYFEMLNKITGLKEMAVGHLEASTPGEIGLAMEFLLEGLHQNSMLSKRDIESTTSYRDMLKAMLDQVSEDQLD